MCGMRSASGSWSQGTLSIASKKQSVEQKKIWKKIIQLINWACKKWNEMKYGKNEKARKMKNEKEKEKEKEKKGKWIEKN